MNVTYLIQVSGEIVYQPKTTVKMHEKELN
jgi:hypothetical protein